MGNVWWRGRPARGRKQNRESKPARPFGIHGGEEDSGGGGGKREKGKRERNRQRRRMLGRKGRGGRSIYVPFARATGGGRRGKGEEKKEGAVFRDELGRRERKAG